MSALNLKYGNGIITLNVRGSASLQKLTPPEMPPLNDVGEAFIDSVTYHCVASQGLNALVKATDQFTILIRGFDRIWMHQDHFVSLLVYYLTSLGVPHANIAVLVAVGLGTAPTKEELKTLVTPQLYGKIQVSVHNCDDSSMVNMGKTLRGTPVLVNPLLNGRKVILVDATRRNPILGYSGGPSGVLNACARTTIESCCKNALVSSGSKLAPHMGVGVLTGNPISEDLIEIANMIKPFFGINLLLSQGRHCKIISGRWLDAWYQSCHDYQNHYSMALNTKMDIAAVSCGGYPSDATLQSFCRSLFHAAQAVADGGTIIFAAECRDGIGNPAFTAWMDTISKETFAQDLLASPNLEGLLFCGMLEILKSRRVLIQSKIHTQTFTKINAQAFRTMETLEAQVDFKDKNVCIITNAENICLYQASTT